MIRSLINISFVTQKCYWPVTFQHSLTKQIASHRHYFLQKSPINNLLRSMLHKAKAGMDSSYLMDLGKVDWKPERICGPRLHWGHLWLRKRSQNININRIWRNWFQLSWMTWGVQNFSAGSTGDVGGNSKRTGILSGDWRCDWMLQSHDKTWMDEELLLMDEFSKKVASWDRIYLKKCIFSLSFIS